MERFLEKVDYHNYLVLLRLDGSLLWLRRRLRRLVELLRLVFERLRVGTGAYWRWERGEERTKGQARRRQPCNLEDKVAGSD